MSFILKVYILHEVLNSEAASLIFMLIPQPKLNSGRFAPFDAVDQEHDGLDGLRNRRDLYSDNI